MCIFKRWSEYRKFKKEEKLIKKLNSKVAKISKRVNKLQIKGFNIYYTISKDMKRYRFTYVSPTIFNSTKDEVIREVFGNAKPKEEYLENGIVMYYKGKVELVFEIKNR